MFRGFLKNIGTSNYKMVFAKSMCIDAVAAQTPFTAEAYNNDDYKWTAATDASFTAFVNWQIMVKSSAL